MKTSLCFKIKVCFNFIFFHKINTTNQNQFIEIFKVCMPLHFWFFLWIILMATASYHGKDLFCLFLLFFFTINYYMATQVSLVLFNQYHQILDSPWLSVLTPYLVITCLSCVQYCVEFARLSILVFQISTLAVDSNRSWKSYTVLKQGNHIEICTKEGRLGRVDKVKIFFWK